jgi:hypothetical protein
MNYCIGKFVWLIFSWKPIVYDPLKGVFYERCQRGVIWILASQSNIDFYVRIRRRMANTTWLELDMYTKLYQDLCLEPGACSRGGDEGVISPPWTFFYAFSYIRTFCVYDNKQNKIQFIPPIRKRWARPCLERLYLYNHISVFLYILPCPKQKN